MKYLIPLLFLLVACSGEEAKDEILHLRDQDISVENYRAHIRAQASANAVAWASLCRDIQALDGESAINYLTATTSSTPTLYRGSVRTSPQTPEPASQRRVVAILKDECKR